MIVGLDVGRSSVKVVTGARVFSFPSYLGEWRERKLTNSFSENDLEVEFEGQKYFAGTLAQHESEFCRSMMTDEKDHADTRLLALIALHRVGASDASVVTGLPVGLHDDQRKQRIRELLLGRWEITVNSERKVIRINRVEVAVEGGAAFWVSPQDGLVRILDVGSKTVNFVTVRDHHFIDRESGTLPFGFDTNRSSDIRQMAARIAGELGKKWGNNDRIMIIGGRAAELQDYLHPYFPSVYAVKNPLFANATGFYQLGRSVCHA